MASVSHDGRADGKPHAYRSDQGFFLAISLLLTGLTLAGFLQLAARGITNPVTAPPHVHIHALLLVGWLSLFCVQNWLAWRGKIALHRKLGWASLVLLTAIILANFYVTVAAIDAGRTGVFTPDGFLALGTADTLCFACLGAWGIWQRRDTQWHRRLIFGAALMLAAPGFNRLLGELPGILGIVLPFCTQLGFAAVLGWHDRRVLGRVHPATLIVVAALVLQRSAPLLLPMASPWVAFSAWVLG